MKYAFNMKLGEHLQTQLRKQYEPSALISMKYKGNDLAFKTDQQGNAVMLFIGKNVNGKIRGHRYQRILKVDEQGIVIKDHWELKGRAS